MKKLSLSLGMIVVSTMGLGLFQTASADPWHGGHHHHGHHHHGYSHPYHYDSYWHGNHYDVYRHYAPPPVYRPYSYGGHGAINTPRFSIWW
jgi:hypothetical protein